VIPRSPGLGATRVNLDLVHLRDNERDFGLDKNGVTLAFTETPWRHVTLREAGDLENNNIDIFEADNIEQLIHDNPDPRVSKLLRVPDGNTTLVTLRLSLGYDQRDSPFVPTRGFLVSFSSELASTLRTENSEFLSRFLKLEIAANGYLPITRSIVLAGQVRVGRIVHLVGSSQTYPNHAFFLGGVETLRGYYQDELIPQDATELAKDPDARKSLVRSGDAFVLVRAELRFPIYGQLGGGLFADFGNLWKNAANMNPLDLRPTAGVGLRLSSPVGPIAVDYGIVLLRRAELAEPFGTLQFSIGLF
jgi:outer membrane protein insertion porin family